MRILAIETSCDETAISIVEAEGSIKRPMFKVLAHLISSQTKLHAEYGGVVPSLAKREHSRNSLPLLIEALKVAQIWHGSRDRENLTIETATQVRIILEREPELLDQFFETIPTLKKPEIDLIAVTQGPGLEPALWVGINLAKALSFVWGIPVIPINHMEGHVLSVLLAEADNKRHIAKSVKFPALALLISGGHTELVLSRDWLEYEVIGQTRDDAVGEAFDKVARILGLPYPGGPEISKMAELATGDPPEKLPRPMLNSHDFDFSFSGLKTAVLYLYKKLEPVDQITRIEIAAEFQQAVIEVLLVKSCRAIEEFKPKTLIIGGGVVANKLLREQFKTVVGKRYPKVKLLTPDFALSTDNATMIAIAAYIRALKEEIPAPSDFAAHGTMALS